MSDKTFPQSGLPIRKTVELLPNIFRTSTNDKFMSAVVDPMVQPGTLQKLVGYIGRRYGKTYNGNDTYLDTDQTLRSRYQLETGVVSITDQTVSSFYDYLDFKNQLKFFGNENERDDLITSQEHYSWNPPINWDKFINYREYYWEPAGPPAVPVFGQSNKVVSTYKVSLGLNSFIFTPDSFTNNPTVTLYRGQTYKFQVKVPGEGFAIRTNYDTGSLLFNPNKPYAINEVAVYDGKLWKAINPVSPADGSSITVDSQDWELVESIATGTALNYDDGVKNNGIETGTVTFTVPYDAPDILFYQGLVSPDRFGRFLIADIESNTKINVDREIKGKTTYTSSNGIEFSNGMVVEFRGQVTPAKYGTDTWLVEGVGTAITLTKFVDLIVPALTTSPLEVVFDNEGFDTLPFDDATAYPGEKDYITIAKDSIDANPWSRYNRWFHRSVLEYAYTFRGEDFAATETLRAKRPIIEFQANLQLFNHGAVAKTSVDYIDTYTTDVFSDIEGSTGYNIDGENLFQGARILIVADTDSLVNNKIYEVNFIVHNNRTQITLTETFDSDSAIGDGVLVQRGNTNSGYMFHFNGTAWVKSQEKTAVNQAPVFDMFDADGVSLSDPTTYPVSSFAGSKLLSYKTGNSVIDSELGFSLSYLNIDNVGDIEFNWALDTDSFSYTINLNRITERIATGFYKINPINEYANGWTDTDPTYLQPIIDSQVISSPTNSITFNTIDWKEITDTTRLEINLYLNGSKIEYEYTRNLGTFTFTTFTFAENDVLSVKLITDLPPAEGYYELPVGLEKNPLNQSLSTFTYGQAIDHISTATEFDSSFVGALPGLSNLRDINDYQPYAKRFLKHAGISALAVNLLCDRTNNIVKSIQYAKKSYTEFKNNFISKATTIDYNPNMVNFVDDIMAELGKTKNSASAFSNSDMIGSGAYTNILYTVEDTGIKTFALSTNFTLTELSNRAVYVYVNDIQLLNSVQYEFNNTFGFVTLSIDLFENDVVEIREYISTSACYIPPTPTSLGLYKKYTPMKFVDDTYLEPREVIQGHDGSITAAYGDFRDDLLLELEYRIYNNIKQEYNPTIFNIDDIVGGYYGTSVYSKGQLDAITAQEFLKWVQNTNINYTLNEYFDSENSFTYTYSNMVDPSGQQNLPGYWRGVYQWFYDTDRPHRCPWEMLGFSEKPTWWESQYGAAPYTRGNLLLWEDMRDGIIRQGTRAGIYDRYKRSTIISHIPVDDDGNLLSPLDSGLAGNFTLINNRGSFALGDVSPVEYAWKAGSEWPFAVTMAMCLMKPFDFITNNFDKSNVTKNKLGQTIDTTTKVFHTLADITLPTLGTKISTGLSLYISSYAKSKGRSLTEILDTISTLDVKLSSRLSGFVDKAQQKYILDSKNPKASSNNIYIPPENYDIIFNVSAPIANVAYSAMILEKTEGGWLVMGYDDIHPYFNYYPAIPSKSDPIISVGGVSETFVDWTTNKTYNNGQIVRQANSFYRAIKTHTSGTVFELTNWKKLPKLPLVGAVEASRRKNFNQFNLSKLSYGTKLTTVQEVVDLLLGYEAYLKSIGFTFNQYDSENQVSRDWTSSAKEFMFWTKQSWAIGSLITLSPGAAKLDVAIPVGVADSILDGFYDYQLLKADGKTLQPTLINVNRSFQQITIETTNTTEGIHFLKLYYVLKEHVVVFDDRTVFNDVIYDKTTGYRQDRIKAQGYRTVDWDGDYTSPGFLFDNVDITAWSPFVDYKLGDIVSYRSYNWTSLVNQLGSETFVNSNWSKLDSTPEKQLIPNFDYKVNQIEDYYNVDSEGIGETQRDLARHATGYQTREYLQNLAQDPTTQYQLYRGFVREKGTSNAITKVFDKLSRSSSDSISLYEEWAFKTGSFGGVDQSSEVEIELVKNNFKIDPQPVLLETSETKTATDKYYRIAEPDFTIKLTPFTTAINPQSYESAPVRTAGYVKTDQVEIVLRSRDDLLTLDINTVAENDNIWITFDSYSWTVLRYNDAPQLNIISATLDGTTVTVELSRYHTLAIDEIVGIKNVTNLTGFFKITAVGLTTFDVEVPEGTLDPQVDTSSIINLSLLTEARYSSIETVNQADLALLNNGSKIWIDNNGSDKWEVIQKNKQYTDKQISEYGTTTPVNAGTKVIFDINSNTTISSVPGSGYVMTYIETDTGLGLKQIIPPPAGFDAAVAGSFGTKMAISPDSRWLVVASPLASGVRSNFKGDFGPSAPFTPALTYTTGDIVLYAGILWKAIDDVFTTDYSTIDLDTGSWEPATSIPALSLGSSPGFTQQGMISVYEFADQQWKIHSSFLSPRPQNFEFFGSEVTMGQSGSTYYMAVAATGSMDSRGRVYLYEYNGTEWVHAENTNYAGIYDPTGSTSYPEGSIVWADGSLWQSTSDQVGDGSTITIDAGQWTKLDPVSTHNSLPSNISIEDDGSTLLNLQQQQIGLQDSQLAELIKIGDEFGSSLAMSRDGSVLVVGAPNSDGQYFANYRGYWRSNVEYTENDVVKYQGTYHKLIQRAGEIDSSITTSFNEEPVGLPWENVGDSTSDTSGKVFVYQRSIYGKYELKQTINAGSLAGLNDLEVGASEINVGDQFGYAIDIDYSGTTLVVTSPKADMNYVNQGSAYVFRTDSLATIEFRLKQKLESFEKYANEYFGQAISISIGGEKVAVGAKNTPYINVTMYDGFATSFDQGKTNFSDSKGSAGAVYVYELVGSSYLLAEKLETTLSPFESFGESIDCTYSVIVVGSPDYVAPVIVDGSYTYPGEAIGVTRLFRKPDNALSLEIVEIQPLTVDLTKIKKIDLYDNIASVKLQSVDYVNNAKLKILNLAEQELSFKTIYDPAVYNTGTEDQTVEETQAWSAKNVGKLWWDLSTAKWIDYEQGDIAYKISNWNVLAKGSSIDVYEWVESTLLPNEWAALADTTEGLAEGISGQPKYPNNDVYTVKELYNSVTGEINGTLYYYWVKGKVNVPNNMPSRRISAATVTSYISNPATTGIAFVALVDSDKVLTYNFKSVIPGDTALLNFQYYNNSDEQNPVHTEYQLLTEGVADSLPSLQLETKWIDSLAGTDLVGNKVPNPNLSDKQKYGISFRPRQGMFIDRLTALKSVVESINTNLELEAFSDTIDFTNLNLVDVPPSAVLNLYDVEVDTDTDLITVGTIRIRQAILQVNLVDGKVDTIDIIDSGFGYKPNELVDPLVNGVFVGPTITVNGTGTGAKATCYIDNQGRVISVNVISKGRKYSEATAVVRRFSVLVNADSTANNFWSIYAWDDSRKVFFRSQSQSYDTTRYWNYIDWWKTGYSPSDRIVLEIPTITELPTIKTIIGDLIRIKEYGSRGWAVFERTGASTNTYISIDEFLSIFTMVGRESGTIKISDSLYNATIEGIGYDNTLSFDAAYYDIENSKELRNILKAVKEDIYVGNYSAEWNKLFFSSVKYAFAEQQYIDWAFKTSFLNATHNVGSLEKKLNYKNDNLNNFIDYINEVKPYRTTIREYVSNYNTLETTPSAIADFDLPPAYSAQSGKIDIVSKISSQAESYPWKWWADNNGYSVIGIEVYNAGEDYTTIPSVLIDGNGTGATARAYISNGRISGIEVLTAGSGYTKSPTVTIVGGNPASSAKAKASAILGDSKVRTFNLSVKFDRITKTGLYSSFDQTQTFIGTGATAVFNLNYAPTRDKSKISVVKNGQVVLSDEYNISLYNSTVDSYSLLRGKITFVAIPAAGDEIVITYEKNDSLLDSVNRIQKFYAPSTGMKGNELGQLMTGIDFGGVQIQGTTFDVTGGWDALPWFTDNWDSVESSADYYVVCDGSTNTITLPFTPKAGQEINIYIKREGTQRAIRIDDPAFDTADESSTAVNPSAEMPTFIGDGVTNVVEFLDPATDFPYVETAAGDILIFRPSDSDGSVSINDNNLLDTNLSGGTLSSISGAYATATGLNAEDISIDGDKFISPDQVPATEENIPGQVLDSVSIKVFNNTPSGAAPLQSRTIVADGTTRFFDIGLSVLETNSVLVFVNKINQEDNFTIDFGSNQIEFITAPSVDSIIEIISIGIGGIALLDYQEFVADGETNLFLTRANYADTSSVFVTVNGIYQDVGFINSSDLTDTKNKTLIQFGENPNFGDNIQIVCMGAGFDTDSSGLPIVRVNQQTFEFEGSTRNFDLADFINLPRGSITSSMIVEVNGVALRGPDTSYFVYDGIVNQFTLGVDPEEPAGAILTGNIKVFVNNELATVIQDYVYDGTSKVVTINTNILNEGDIIKIENDLKSQFQVENNNLVIDPAVVLSSPSETQNDIINVTWFSEYPTMRIISDEFTGGKSSYYLSRTPLSVSYVWVYKNGIRLTKDTDYFISLPRGTVYLTEDSTVADLIKIVMFGTTMYKSPSAYEIHKDMLNIYSFKRYAITDVSLAEPLNYYDQQIVVTDASSLTDPIPSRNIPGAVKIGSEKIEFMSKNGNVLSQLRRGAAGTPIGLTYTLGSDVVDMGSQETIPYNESQDRADFISNGAPDDSTSGSYQTFGPLDFTPSKSTRSTAWTRVTIPAEFGPCDEIEVFVAGRRLRKDPITVYNETLGASSPAADTILEAEFSVDGISNEIRITATIPAGTRISIIRRTGKSWYDRGEATASSGVTLLDNATTIANFIAKRTTKLPE